MFSIQVPTFQRPEMLRRSLKSLACQSEPRWTATVFDDSPTGEGERVVRELADRRIVYRRNPERLGAAANVDQCFLKSDSTTFLYGCILEDDNFFLPDYLGHVSEVMQRTQARLALFNQIICQNPEDIPDNFNTTRGGWFSEGWLDPRDLHASLLLMEGLSNGGMVWRWDASLKLQVGSSVALTGLHEACRSLLVSEPIWFSPKALAVWTQLPVEATAQNYQSSRIIGRGNQAVTRFVIGRYGSDAVVRAALFARDRVKKEQLVKRLLHAGAWKHALSVDRRITPARLGVLLKGAANRFLVKDPCHEFLANLRGH